MNLRAAIYYPSACLMLGFVLYGCTGCGSEYSQLLSLKTSTRRVMTEYSFLQRTSERLVGKLPGGGKRSSYDSSRLTPLAQKNLITRYNYLYSTLNPMRPERVGLYFDSAQSIFWTRDSSRERIRFGAEVYGWHPAWMSDNWLLAPFRLLTTLSYYSYNVDPATGGCLNPADMEAWRSIALVDSAHAYDCRVLLSVACDGADNSARFLTNTDAWSLLSDSLSSLLRVRKADGVEVSFSDIPSDMGPRFTAFIEALSQSLEKSLPGGDFYLSIVLPPDDPDLVFNLDELQRLADMMVVQGYEYADEEGAAVAVAPLLSANENGPSLDRTVRTYMDRGLDTQMAVLALPLYGNQWRDTLDAQKGNYVSRFDRKVTYSEIRRVYNPLDTSYVLTPSLDPLSMTNYYLVEFPDRSAIECWFDDDFTLGRKMDLAMARGFRGVGLWALGYDVGHDEIWKQVRNRFATDTVQFRDPVTAFLGYPIRIGNFFLRHGDLIATTSAVFTLTVVLAMFLAFSDWRVRTSIFYEGFNFFVYILVSSLLMVPLLSWLGFFGDTRSGLLIAFLVGIGAGYLIFRLTKSMQFKRP
ncbi:MAG: hypothetical protein FJX89_06675 [Bacteroidetes bacterium]|nr:hypothetical protein [Bacteroidota bacterium]